MQRKANTIAIAALIATAACSVQLAQAGAGNSPSLLQWLFADSSLSTSPLQKRLVSMQSSQRGPLLTDLSRPGGEQAYPPTPVLDPRRDHFAAQSSHVAALFSHVREMAPQCEPLFGARVTEALGGDLTQKIDELGIRADNAQTGFTRSEVRISLVVPLSKRLDAHRGEIKLALSGSACKTANREFQEALAIWSRMSQEFSALN